MTAKTKAFLGRFPKPELMSNCLTDLACPHCGCRDGIQIEVKRWASFSDHGTEDEPDDTEYEGRNPARCSECNHSGTVARFTFPGLDTAIEEGNTIKDVRQFFCLTP